MKKEKKKNRDTSQKNRDTSHFFNKKMGCVPIFLGCVPIFQYMRMAIEEAKRGIGKAEPNPAVGCVIVKHGRVLSKGFHRRFGANHAEIDAIRRAKTSLKGAELYVTLEPCSSFGKTPPCVDAIIKAGISKVIIGLIDPNPVNRKNGVNRLRENGIKVITGVLRNDIYKLNKKFIDRFKQGRPFVTLKLAQSLDGKIAAKSGDSKWITSQDARDFVHKLRSHNDAVLVGVNTVKIDNPLLTNRVENNAFQPIKIIVDSNLSTPLNSKIFSKNSPAKVIIAATERAPKQNELLLKENGAEILRISSSDNKVNLKELMIKLMLKGINNILVEGGGEIAASFIKEKLVDKVMFFIAPIIIGGSGAAVSVGGEGIAKIAQAYKLINVHCRNIGKDILIEGEFKS